MSNQDIEGNVPAGDAPAASPGTPEYFEQQLTKEREARALMRDRLRHTEALAAESHALRARMAEELERVTADRNRLRTAAETATPATPDFPTPSAPAAAPPMTPHAADWPLKPPAPPRRSGPWRALAMLGGLAAAVGLVTWLTGTVPGMPDAGIRTAHEAPAAPVAPPAASAAVAAAAPAPAAIPSGAVALPPLTPEAQLAAAPTGAGPAPAGMAARLRKALDGEGIAAPVEIDAATGHVVVADPKADSALRERTDMLIRAVYAGASVPEPQIEHRWLSPMRAALAAPATPAAPAPAADAEPAPAPTPAPRAAMTAAQAYAARHAAQAHAVDHHGKAAAPMVADAEELRPVLPEGRVTASCRTSLAGRTPHRADMTACMKTSCCRAGAGQSEECRAYQRAYPFTCGAG